MLRDPGTIEAEPRSLAAALHDAPEGDVNPTVSRIDELLDEWNRSLAVLSSYGMQLWPD